jgi:cell division septal protein FtsQ
MERWAMRFPRGFLARWRGVPAPKAGEGTGAPAPEPGRRPRALGWRALAAGLAALEAGLLGAMAFAPAFQVHHVDVSGEHRVSGEEVVRLAGLDRPVSVFTLDPVAVRGALERSTWIRAATVEARLPDRVSIDVEEWRPVAVYRAGSGPAYYVSDQAIALGPVPAGEDLTALTDVQGPAGPDPQPGRAALDPRLLTALVNIQRGLPGLIGQQARSFQLDGCGNLIMITARGWRAEFGRVLTPEEFASLGDKVAALKAASASLNYSDSGLDYVNVMNPDVVAVHQRAPGRRSPTLAPSSAPGPLVIEAEPAPACG